MPVKKLNWKCIYSLLSIGGENYCPYWLYIPVQTKIHQPKFSYLTVS